MVRRTFTADDPALPMNYPGFVFRTLRDDGYAAEALLDGTGLTDGRLSDPSFRSGLAPIRRLIANALALTGDPHLGPRLASRFDCSFIGLPAYAAMNAANLRDGLCVVSRFFALTFPSFEFYCRVAEPAPGEAVLSFRPKLAFGEIEYFVLSSALVASEGLLRAMLRTRRVALRGELALREPEGWAAPTPRVDFPVTFEAREHRIVFPAALLDTPLPGADPINHRRLLDLCARFAREAEVERTPAAQVVAFLEAGSLGAPLAKAATALGYSERGLRRELARCGGSYRSLSEQVRERRAREMLADGARPIQTIAHELGFESPSNFARSFRRWTGSSPKAFRESLRTHGKTGRN